MVAHKIIWASPACEIYYSMRWKLEPHLNFRCISHTLGILHGLEICNLYIFDLLGNFEFPNK